MNQISMLFRVSFRWCFGWRLSYGTIASVETIFNIFFIVRHGSTKNLFPFSVQLFFSWRWSEHTAAHCMQPQTWVIERFLGVLRTSSNTVEWSVTPWKVAYQTLSEPGCFIRVYINDSDVFDKSTTVSRKYRSSYSTFMPPNVLAVLRNRTILHRDRKKLCKE